MIVDTLQILSQYGNSTVARIRQNLSSTGTDATMETSRSLRFEVTDQGFIQTLRVLGKPYFMVAETGRRPTPNKKPSPQFVENIKKWQQVRGSEYSAYGIAMSINKYGTKLWQQGGRKDIVSNVVDETLTAQITKDILAKFADHYLKNAVQIVSNIN